LEGSPRELGRHQHGKKGVSGQLQRNISMESFSSQFQNATCHHGNGEDSLQLEEDTCQARSGEFLGLKMAP